MNQPVLQLSVSRRQVALKNRLELVSLFKKLGEWLHYVDCGLAASIVKFTCTTCTVALATWQNCQIKRQFLITVSISMRVFPCLRKQCLLPITQCSCMLPWCNRPCSVYQSSFYVLCCLRGQIMTHISLVSLKGQIMTFIANLAL